MKTFLASLLILCLVPASMATPFQGYADLVDSVQAAVVNIQVTSSSSEEDGPRGGQMDPFQFFFRQQQGRPQGPQAPQQHQQSGTGFIISTDGYIVTNRHVVKDSEKIQVLLNSGKTYTAKLIGTDDSMDVAVIKIEGTGLPALKVGDSQKIRIGDEVLALGFPLSLGFSVTRGIISGIGRDFRTNNFDLATYLQTDADITFGNSGGPLINTDGEVIAINTMIMQNGDTYGFSIPSHLFMNSVKQLRDSGKVRRGALGIRVGDLDEESKDYYKIESGALVAGVTPGQAAAAAGLKDGDIILAIDDRKVKGSSEVITDIGNRAPGDRVKLQVLHQGTKVERTVTLGDREEVVGRSPLAKAATVEDADTSSSGLGFTVADLTGELRERLGVEESIKGVIVDEVDPNGLAARKGISTGALITKVAGTATPSSDSIKKVTSSLKKDEVVPVTVMERSRSSDGDAKYQERTVFLRKQ